MNILVTGGLGFIGSHFIKYLLMEPSLNCNICNVDNGSYGSNVSNLSEYQNEPRYIFVKSDINEISRIQELHKFNTNFIVNVAAETHVDRSISDPSPFIHSNYHGTFELLEYARKNDTEKFVQISTDEVYGEALQDYSFKETDPINPGNPYSASKAGADLLVKSYCRTYGINGVITRCSNNFGPNQFPEKLVPKSIISILRGMPISVYGDGEQVRDWLYVQDHVRAIYDIMLKGRAGEIYNISAANLFKNIDIVKKICAIVKTKTEKETKIIFSSDRPGHDRRYSLNSRKIMDETGWLPKTDFDNALVNTVTWYLDNERWWIPLLGSSSSSSSSSSPSSSSILDPQPWNSSWNRIIDV